MHGGHTKENLKRIKVGKLKGKLHQAKEDLAEEEWKAAKIKANKKAVNKAKAA